MPAGQSDEGESEKSYKNESEGVPLDTTSYSKTNRLKYDWMTEHGDARTVLDTDKEFDSKTKAKSCLPKR